jgi:uncharacterized protein (DUF4213/DUF364 family)
MQSIEPEDLNSVTVRIAAVLEVQARNVEVADVRIGLGYTAVQLADERLGLAFTFRDEARSGCAVIDSLTPLSLRPASDLLTLLGSSNPFEAGVGLACANALANCPSDRFLDGDILEHLELRSSDNVAMVGHFGPLVQALKQRTNSLTVFERVQVPKGELRPAEEAYEFLPKCQVALVTATSLVNHKIDSLLRAAKVCREVAVLGASTPMLPDAFDAMNVTMLSEVVTRDSQHILRIISEGGGFRQFKSYGG